MASTNRLRKFVRVLTAEVGPEVFNAGQVDRVSPSIGDIHRVANVRPDGPSVSIHVYGANIGAVQRSRFDLNGCATPFVSGYSNDFVPNLWDRALPEL